MIPCTFTVCITTHGAIENWISSLRRHSNSFTPETENSRKKEKKQTTPSTFLFSPPLLLHPPSSFLPLLLHPPSLSPMFCRGCFRRAHVKVCVRSSPAFCCAACFAASFCLCFCYSSLSLALLCCEHRCHAPLWPFVVIVFPSSFLPLSQPRDDADGGVSQRPSVASAGPGKHKATKRAKFTYQPFLEPSCRSPFFFCCCCCYHQTT